MEKKIFDDIIDSDNDHDTERKMSGKANTAVDTTTNVEDTNTSDNPTNAGLAVITLPPKPTRVVAPKPVVAASTVVQQPVASAPAAPAATPATAAQLSVAKMKLQQALNLWNFNYHDPTVSLDPTVPLNPAVLQLPIAAELGAPATKTQETTCKAFFDFLGANFMDLTIRCSYPRHMHAKSMYWK